MSNSAKQSPHILVCATQGEPTRLTQLLRAEFSQVEQLQTVRLEATGECDEFGRTLGESLGGIDRDENLTAWVVLTSPGGIGVVWNRVPFLKGLPGRELRRLKFAVVGEATAAALREEGLEPTYISGPHGPSDVSGRRKVDSKGSGARGGGGAGQSNEKIGAAALAEGLAASGLVSGAAVHVLQSNRADSSVWAPLQMQAKAFHRWIAYRSDLMPAQSGGLTTAIRAGEFTAAAFTSGSTVEGLYAVLGADEPATTRLLQAMRCFSIGPTATKALQTRGVLQVFDAAEPTVPSLAEAVRAGLKGEDEGRRAKGEGRS